MKCLQVTQSKRSINVYFKTNNQHLKMTANIRCFDARLKNEM